MAALVEQEQEGRLGQEGRLARRGRARWLLLLPSALLAAYAVAWKLRAPPPARGEGELSSAASHAAPSDVAGYAGARDLGAGRLAAQLLPLQAVPAWEEFDAAALARRLKLAAGEPWRLDLRLEGDAGAPELSLAALSVVDAGGTALAPPENGAGAAPAGAPADPLRVLLLEPARALPAGAEVQLFLWGRAPTGEVRLVLGGEPGLELDLSPVRVPSSEVLRHVARVDAPAPASEDAR